MTYPDGFHTHTRVQRFYFDRDFMLRRMNYKADVNGCVASHYCYDAKPFDGIVFPTLRRVVRRTAEGSMLSDPTAFLLDYVNVTVRSSNTNIGD